jgi:hypothetical protein
VLPNVVLQEQWRYKNTGKQVDGLSCHIGCGAALVATTFEGSAKPASKHPLMHCIMVQIPMKKLPLFVLIIALAGCATMASSPKLTYTPEVRRQTSASDTSFHDLLTALGGVGHSDRVAYPEAKERTIVQIEVLLPYDNHRAGSERWTIRHDGGKTAVYQVSLIPDGEGATDFTVREVK